MHRPYLTPKIIISPKINIAACPQLQQLFKIIIRSKIKEKGEPE
jgi:hypothetical protein